MKFNGYLLSSKYWVFLLIWNIARSANIFVLITNINVYIAKKESGQLIIRDYGAQHINMPGV